MKFTIYQESRPGKRANNEDRLAHSYSRDALLLVIADGMPFEFAGYKISIVDSKPDAMLGNVIRSDEYVVTFHIESALTDIVDNPTNPAGGTVPSGDGASGSACEAVGGQWDNANSECLGIEANACQEIGGEFNECASACRNDPYAEVCTMQCVQVCQFK